MSSNSSNRGSFRKSARKFGRDMRKVFRSPSPLPLTPGANQLPGTPSTNPSPTSTHGIPSIHNTSQSPNTPSVTPGTVGDVGNAAWARLETALEVLRDSSGMFPPLKSAIGGLLTCFDVLQSATERRRDYNELAVGLTILANDLGKHLRQSRSSQMSNCVSNVVNGLEKQISHINDQQQRWGPRRYVQTEQDVEDPIGCYRRIEALFRQLQSNAILSVWSITNEHLVNTRLEGMNPAKQAWYDSDLSMEIRRLQCTPNTRQLVLAELRSWADDPNGPKVYWMNGMAGTGKTTIACTLCAELGGTRQLAASFFCSRALPDCREVTRIVPTIAYQLARFSHPFQAVICRVLGDDPDIRTRDISVQFQKLINEPLLEVKSTLPPGIVATIDALDECTDRDAVQLFLDLLFRYAGDLPIKFLVTCRPEPGILDQLLSRDDRSRCVLHLHDIEQSLVRADIETYLCDELASIPLSQDHVNLLAERAGRLFIYAATVVRYLKPRCISVDPSRRLEIILGATSESDNRAYKKIDSLYATVLATALEHDELESWEAENIRLLLHTVVCAMEPMTTQDLAGLLKIDTVQVAQSALEPLRSVLHISESSGLVSILHASFSDYMLSRNRSVQFFCDRSKHSQLLAQRCFDVMTSSLRFNICNLESSFVFDTDVPDLPNRVDNAISPHLFYACRYWGDHLESAERSDALYSSLIYFLSHQLLFWTEVLNLKKCITKGASILFQVHALLQGSVAPVDVCELARDAWKFLMVFGTNPISRSTPHLYVSGLPFWPQGRPMWVQYVKEKQGPTIVEGPAMSWKQPDALVVWTSPGDLMSVSVSPNGAWLVSGSRYNYIHVWDAQSGEMVAGPFKGHTGSVTSVAFSPNGARIVSGSLDNTIRIWDTQSGDLVAGPFEGHTRAVKSVAFHLTSGDVVAGPFKGHTDVVTSVMFSLDGARVVSGSYDGSIHVWDAYSGDVMAGPFKGHTHIVTSVAFSPNGARIVSGSWDKTVRIWDAENGNLVAGPFEGHTRGVTSVAFSPDGACVVSGSDDNTIRAWDARSGDVVAGPFRGHTDTVTSVMFLHDGTRVVSGSYDKSIRIWEVRSGHAVANSLDGHAQWVGSVVFSPDGARIASGSWDKTICVWDAQSGDLVAGPFEGHTDTVTSVAFSPGGTRLVSGSFDNTIRVWDAQSGDLVAGPFEGHTYAVKSVAFSPDGARVVSGSSDSTIRIWDAQSGDVLVEPLRHADAVVSVVLSPDGARVISSSTDKTICIWDARSGDVVEKFKAHNEWITSAALSSDGSRIVSGAFDNTVRIWDAKSGGAVAGPFKHTHWVSSVAFSPDGARVVSGSYDNSIRVWDIQSGDLVAGPFEGHTDAVTSVAFSPDGAHVVSGSKDRAIRIWDMQSGSSVNTSALYDWNLSEDGWIIGLDMRLLLWVPPDFRAGLKRPQNTVVICSRGSLEFKFDSVRLRPKWQDYYSQ